jgi:hypothetical protein
MLGLGLGLLACFKERERERERERGDSTVDDDLEDAPMGFIYQSCTRPEQCTDIPIGHGQLCPIERERERERERISQ